MAIQAGASGTRAERLRLAAKTKDRNRKIVLGLLGGLFVIILAVELPSTLSKLSGSAGGGTPAPAQPAAGGPTATLVQPSLTSALKQLQKLGAKDPFIAQVAASGATAATTGGSSGTTAKGPAVRAKDFVAKDPFVAQISTASATPVATATPTTGTAPTTAPVAAAPGGGGYVVVLNSVPAAHSQKLASLAVVAAENAGLIDVKTSTLATTGSALDVYTGPYQSQSTAQQELIRALRDGYTQATVSNLPRAHRTQ